MTSSESSSKLRYKERRIITMKEINENIAVNAIFSDDGKHRYSLSYTWSEKPRLSILMIAPGSSPKLDSEHAAKGLTEQLCINNCSRLGTYGGITIINLFSRINDDYVQVPKNSFKGATNEENDEVIMKMIDGTDIVFAFGSVIATNKIAYLRALELVKKIEEKYPNRLFCLHDGIRKFLHPLDIYTRNEFCLLSVKNVADYIREHSKFGKAEEKVPEKSKSTAGKKKK